ncbi:MAG TPA: pyruvate, water dikinase regulatory protein [Patescibacteria group bacterium]|jgi:regulator of PEP synthase PpsR (kinase-PPPase family)|nr:pyruvate, water dikinase regulatory protein [Patescibacteria group bacterium]
MKMANAVIYAISDSFEETAATVAKVAAAQFADSEIIIDRFLCVKDRVAIDQIIESTRNFNSLLIIDMLQKELKDYLIHKAMENNIAYFDIMEQALTTLSGVINQKPKLIPEATYQLNEEYFDRMEAIDFAVKYDDCKDPRAIKKADLVLIGISRTSKTPLSIFLATKNIKVANIPLVPEVVPPRELFEIPKERIFGLITSKQKLNTIRMERLKAHGLSDEANYASFERIDYELKYADQIMKDIGCLILNVADKAIEETASTILQILKEVNASEKIRLQF